MMPKVPKMVPKCPQMMPNPLQTGAQVHPKPPPDRILVKIGKHRFGLLFTVLEACRRSQKSTFLAPRASTKTPVEKDPPKTHQKINFG